MVVLCTFIIAILFFLTFFDIECKGFNLFFFVIFFIISFSTLSQNLNGTVKDALSNPLQNVNIIAEPLQEGYDLKFAITDHLGRYKLILEKNLSYKITVSYIGYATIELEIYSDFSNKEHHFILKEKEELLDEIVIKHKPMPVFVNKDTITYDIDYFKNGKEYKMIDILEKLPGFEIEKNGAIKVKGKEVTKVLVENKPFFGGSSKLAIENIPADALDKIEVIDNFNEVGFLKEVSDSKEMVLNVKLKEDKKKFIFGDTEAGLEIAGDNGFHSLHAALFSYNKKTNLSYIGNLNNIGSRTFSFEDLMRFQNVKSNFISNNNRSTNLSNIGIGNTDVLKTKTQFSALMLSFDINPKLTIDGYGLFSKLSTTSLQENDIKYLQNDYSTLEKRVFRENKNDLIALGNLKINFAPSTTSRMIYNVQYQFIKPKSNNITQSEIDNQSNIFKKNNRTNGDQITQFFEWHKSFNDKHITTLAIDQHYENNKVQSNLLSNNPFLDEYITFQPDDTYDIFQNKYINSNSLDVLAKHYWILHKLHHLYINMGNSLNVTTLGTLDQQLLSDGSVINLFDNGYNNELKYSLDDFYLGLEYKIKTGKWENKMSLFAHHYSLITKQGSKQQIKSTLLEPKWNSVYEFNPSESIKFEYKFSNRYPVAAQMLEQFSITDYNTIFQGNALLRNEKFQILNLDYSKYNLYKGLIIYANANFSKKNRSIRNSINLIGVDNFETPEMITTPENRIKLSGMIEKQIHKFKISFRSTFSQTEYLQIINDVSLMNRRNNQNINIIARTADKKLPSISVHYRKSFSQFSGFTNSSLVTDNLNFSFDMVLFENFNFKTNYEIVYNKNQDDNSNKNQIANATLTYKKKNNPLSFELSAQNYLNNHIKIENRFSDFTIKNNKIYTLPRILMLSLRYKI